MFTTLLPTTITTTTTDGDCIVDETEEGFTVQYIDRNRIWRNGNSGGSGGGSGCDVDDDILNDINIQKQIMASRAINSGGNDSSSSGDGGGGGDIDTTKIGSSNIKMSFASKSIKSDGNPIIGNAFKINNSTTVSASTSSSSSNGGGGSSSSKLSTLEKLKRENISLDKIDTTTTSATTATTVTTTTTTVPPPPTTTTATTGWLYPNIMVKIISQNICDTMNNSLYKKKCKIMSVSNDRFVGVVVILDSGGSGSGGSTTLQIDQDDLQTIVPKIGQVGVLLKSYTSGGGVGSSGIVKVINKDQYNLDIDITSSSSDGGVMITGVEYEDISLRAD